MTTWQDAPTLGGSIQPASIFGTPDTDASLFPGQQSYPDTCAIRCQEAILDEFGLPQTESGLVQEAAEHGWYTPNSGTSPDDVGNLLELHGIPVSRYTHASVFHMALELAQGHKIIVGVHANDLWHQPGGESEGHRADHALIVSGIDTSDPLHVQVVVSDPGTGQPEAHYPMEEFLNAWKDSDFFMVATQEPAPPTLPAMANFDYLNGHIPFIGSVPYDEFHALQHTPDAWHHPFQTLDGSQSVHDSDLGGGAGGHQADGHHGGYSLTLSDIFSWLHDHILGSPHHPASHPADPHHPAHPTGSPAHDQPAHHPMPQDHTHPLDPHAHPAHASDPHTAPVSAHTPVHEDALGHHDYNASESWGHHG